eukprot:scaffold45607_cov237-Amphora_coffeaeformis.AAC.8
MKRKLDDQNNEHDDADRTKKEGEEDLVLYFDATAVTREDVSVCDVHGALGTFLPGMGCDAAASGRTRHALQTRVEAIHSLTQERDRRWETMEERTVELTEKMDRLLRHVAPAHVSMVERGDD